VDREVAQQLRSIARSAQRDKDGVLRQQLRMLLDISSDGVVTGEDIETRKMVEQAQRRASQIGQFLAADLDGDGAITQEERSSVNSRLAVEMEVLFARGDSDGDKIISIIELLRYMKTQAPQQRNHRETRYKTLLLFDMDQDKTVTTDEVIAAIDAIAAAAKDLGANSARPNIRNQTKSTHCEAEKTQEGTDLVVLSINEGAVLSSVAVAGMDEITSVARLVIEPGETPIHLFLAARSNTIWDISGATKRLSKVIVQRSDRSGKPGAGVLGIPREKVQFVVAGSCLEPIRKLEGAKATIAYKQAARSFGRDPEHMLAFSSIKSVELPSGDGNKWDRRRQSTLSYNGKRYELTPEGPKLLDEGEGRSSLEEIYGTDKAFRSLMRFHPNGVQSIAAGDVIAPGDVNTYDVLPQEAGLLQLLLEKKLRYTRDGYFVIEKPIPRFPTGLHGSHAVKFMLAEGVPMPGGSPGHSGVISGETGLCILGHCR